MRIGKARIFRPLRVGEFVERSLRAAPHSHFFPGEDRFAGRQRAFSHVTGADDRKPLRILSRQPFCRDRGGRAGAHHRMIRAVADRQREAGFGMRVDQDGKHRGQIKFFPIALTDRRRRAEGDGAARGQDVGRALGDRAVGDRGAARISIALHQGQRARAGLQQRGPRGGAVAKHAAIGRVLVVAAHGQGHRQGRAVGGGEALVGAAAQSTEDRGGDSIAEDEAVGDLDHKGAVGRRRAAAGQLQHAAGDRRRAGVGVAAGQDLGARAVHHEVDRAQRAASRDGAAEGGRAAGGTEGQDGGEGGTAVDDAAAEAGRVVAKRGHLLGSRHRGPASSRR